MAINDYSTLKQGVADWLARADLTAQIPTFISLAEARLNRELRTRDMQTAATGSIASSVVTLPTDYRAMQSFRVLVGQTYYEIPPLTPDQLQITTTTGGVPLGYVITSGTLRTIGGSGSETYDMTYFAKVPALSDSATQNWLILREPGLYLYGALIEASPYLGDDQRTLLWSQQFRTILDGMHAEDASARYGNAPAMQSSLTNAP